MVCSSSARMKLFGPPRCCTYGCPSALAVARKPVSISARNARSWSSTSVANPPPCSTLAYAAREPRAACTALTASENATSLGQRFMPTKRTTDRRVDDRARGTTPLRLAQQSGDRSRLAARAIAGKQRRGADVRRLQQPRQQPLEPDREATVRRHAPAKRFELAGERIDGEPCPSHRRDELVVPMQSLAARDELGAAEQHVERARSVRSCGIRVRIERPLRERIARHHEKRAACSRSAHAPSHCSCAGARSGSPTTRSPTTRSPSPPGARAFACTSPTTSRTDSGPASHARWARTRRRRP